MSGKKKRRTDASALEVKRCAIYTRKSAEEGLDQEFNTLDAQREAGEAFIASQRHQGWECLPDRYDDDGFTDGNMERPALKRLLADVGDFRRITRDEAFLDADGGIDRRLEGCRADDKAYAAHPRRGDEAGKVAHRPATESNHNRVTWNGVLGEESIKVAGRLKTLCRLPRLLPICARNP